MHDFRPVFLVVGALLAVLALAMCIPAAVDAIAGNPDWQAFVLAASLTLFVGVTMVLSCRSGGIRLNIRQAFLMTTLIWVGLALFAALPFAFSELDLSYTDAFFEAMSGITTTGSTVIVGLDAAPPGILLWRSLLQWLGGVGVIVMAIAVLPMLRVGGMQMFRVEAFETEGKALPRTAEISASISVIYVVLTFLCALGYWLAGMNGFDAINHALTTVSTGGYSTSDKSFALFDNGLIDAIAIAGMIAGSLPFLLYLKAVRGNWGPLVHDTQVHAFLGVVTALVLVNAVWLWLDNHIDPVRALRYSGFNIISVMTGTGYANHEFDRWGPFAMPIFYFIMFVGGCSGSTTCGIKIFRFQILWAAARVQLHHLLQPHGVFIPYYNRRPIPPDVIVSVLSFFFLFGLSFAVLAIALGMLGLDFITAISGAATAISNVGPGLGPVIGPAGTFQPLPDAAKWLLAAGMLLGRLELFTVLVIFIRSFWRD